MGENNRVNDGVIGMDPNSKGRNGEGHPGRGRWKGAVAVTGLGLITGLGFGLESSWPRLLAGESAIEDLPPELFSAPVILPVLLGARVMREALTEAIRSAVPRAIWNTSEPACHLWLLAALEAMAQAGLPLPPTTGHHRGEGEAVSGGGITPSEDEASLLARTGIYVGTGAGALAYTEGAFNKVYTAEKAVHRDLERFAVPKYMASSLAGQLSILAGTRGPAMMLNTACSSGSTALLTALDALRLGRVDRALAGGADLTLSAAALKGFAHLGALAPKDAEGLPPCRPFTKDRAGMVLGEGAACLVLETAEAAAARGARPLAWFLGGAMNAEAHNLLHPREDGSGMEACIREALADAGLSPEQVAHVYAHGTGTSANDHAESASLRACYSHEPTVSATKAFVGHTMGAAGAIDAVLAVKSLEEGRVPPMRMAGDMDPDCAIHPAGEGIHPHLGVENPRSAVQVDSFAFGGHNAVMMWGGPDFSKDATEGTAFGGEGARHVEQEQELE